MKRLGDQAKKASRRLPHPIGSSGLFRLDRRASAGESAKAAIEVATDVMLRFLVILGTLSRDDAQAIAGPEFDHRPRQRVIQVTEAVTITGENFEFVQDFRGLEVLPQKGTLIGREDGREVRTPYDDCVLIMPSRRLVKGQTAVRLGRYID